jgi:Heparinase II/III-like protein
MRDGWTSHSSYLLLDCGTHGALGGAHAHADALAILALSARGTRALVDSGTHTYTGAAALRDQFRATAAHNTLTVDGGSSSVPASAFRWQAMAQAACRTWLSHARFDLFEGEHDGYLRLDAPARHLRSVLFIKGDYWIVRDRVETGGAHRYELNFHFDPRSRVSIETAHDAAANDASTATATYVRSRKADASTGDAQIEAAGTKGAGGSSPCLDLYAFARGGAWREHEELISPVYGAAVPAPVCTYAFSGDASAEAVTLLIPRGADAEQYPVNAEHHTAGAEHYPAGAEQHRAGVEPRSTGAEKYSVREIEAVGGRAFELKGAAGGARDLVLMRASGAHSVETARAASGFEWTWLRFDGDEAEPRELIAVGGGSLHLDGREVLRSPSRINYFVARRGAGDELVFETDAGEELFLALFNKVTSDR